MFYILDLLVDDEFLKVVYDFMFRGVFLKLNGEFWYFILHLIQPYTVVYHANGQMTEQITTLFYNLDRNRWNSKKLFLAKFVITKGTYSPFWPRFFANCLPSKHPWSGNTIFQKHLMFKYIFNPGGICRSCLEDRYFIPMFVHWLQDFGFSFSPALMKSDIWAVIFRDEARGF